MSDKTFDEIATLNERCKQLELVNGTQFLLIGNLEKNVRDLLIRDATKTDQFAILDEHLNVVNTLLRDQQSKFNIMKDMIDVVNDRVNEVNRAANPGEYWEGGPR